MDRDLDLSLLRTFFTIAMTGSFTTASHRLFRTQPAISLRVKRLEDMIGFPLITRSTDGLSLTREGDILLDYAKRILSLNDEVMQRMRKEDPRELVRVGLPEEYAAIDLQTLLKTFAKDYPSAAVTIDVKTSTDLQEDLQDDHLDVVVTVCLATTSENRLTRPIPVVWVAGEQMIASQFGEVRLVLPREENLYRQMALQALANTDTPWDIVCTAANWTSVKSAVLAGMGVSLAPVDMVVPGMRRLGEGLPTLPDIVLSLSCRPRPISDAVRRLRDCLEDTLREKDAVPSS
ncbi:MAG TPA: LysR substrate-binding domain-containing protein [Telmatospirillum sp.]|nr:LysR substrate-binding domain-containing protein [Telmatospirillum sp.]